MTILVIDDEDDIRLLARVGLAAAGHRVLVAASGAEGIETARREQPDVILLDLMMPEMDGYATFAALRADAATEPIPVMFLTAKPRERADDRVVSQPRVSFVNKPFAPRELDGQVRHFLADARKSIPD